MPVETPSRTSIELLQDRAARLRMHSVRATSKAGSGHPTTCASCAEIMSVLFFSVMRYDPQDPKNLAADAFVLSKGHAVPILYAAWAEAGAFPVERLLTLREIGSDLEGHPTPRLPFVDVATGSLGQGLSAGLGLALNARLNESPQRVYVLMGDGESAEGSIWEAAQMASSHQLGNLCATIDVNRLGQSQPTQLEWHTEVYKARWESFGWNVVVVDGHDVAALLNAYEAAATMPGQPTMVLARTVKGKGLGSVEGRENQHGKALDAEQEKEALALCEKQFVQPAPAWVPQPPTARIPILSAPAAFPRPEFAVGGKEVAPRKAFGEALAALGKADARLVTLDADVQNSTYTEEFRKACPERFFQCYIAEQNMVGVATGFAARGRVPFASTFACFLSRAADQIRMASISMSNIKLAGTHVGVSIGEDGPSQMALEDISSMSAAPNFTVLYPSDATSSWQATRLAIETTGPCYLRLGRPNAPILYGPEETFAVGKAKVLRQSDRDAVTVVAGGVTLFEALSAYEELGKAGIAVRVIDLFSIQPIDRETLLAAAQATGGRIVTVEDHFAHGGIGDAVLSALSEEPIRLRKLAVREIARSGKPAELLDRYGISSRHIVEAVKALAAQ